MVTQIHDHWLEESIIEDRQERRIDRTREKFDFYSKVNTRELLIVDRDPWALELYRLADGKLQLAVTSTLDVPTSLPSATVPLTFELIDGKRRPQIEVRHDDGELQWLV